MSLGLGFFHDGGEVLGWKFFFVLKDSGVNHVGYVFMNIIGTGFFYEVLHNVFCLLIFAVSGEESANCGTINVVAVGRESFLPEINGRIDVFASEFRNVSVVFGFGFE